MKSIINTGLLALCASFLVTTPAIGDPKDTLNAHDVKFVKETAQANLNEVKIAELGSTKATNPELKSCAAMLVKDHKTAEAELKALAEKKGISVSGAIDKDTADKYKELEKKSGADFDEAFVGHMDKEHGKCIKKFEDAQKEARDTDLKAWVDKTLVVLKAHHEKIKGLKKIAVR
jgi:putative membrane protein